MVINLTLKSDSDNTFPKHPLALYVTEQGGKKFANLELDAPSRSVQVNLEELRRALDAMAPR